MEAMCRLRHCYDLGDLDDEGAACSSHKSGGWWCTSVNALRDPVSGVSQNGSMLQRRRPPCAQTRDRQRDLSSRMPSLFAFTPLPPPQPLLSESLHRYHPRPANRKAQQQEPAATSAGNGPEVYFPRRWRRQAGDWCHRQSRHPRTMPLQGRIDSARQRAGGATSLTDDYMARGGVLTST